MSEHDMALTEAAATAIFDDWDTGASVRHRANTYDLSDLTHEDLMDRHWFVPGMLPWLKESAVEGRGEAARQELLARSLVFFLDYTTLLETKIVNRAISTVIGDSLGMNLSPEIKMTGLKLYTDEAYHALISADVANQVGRRYGIQNRDPCQDRIDRLYHLVNEVEEPFRELAWFVVGFVSETVITKEFLVISKSTIVKPVFNMLRDHLEDELKHSAYFSHLFDLIWNRSSESKQRFISDFLPSVIWEFFRLHESWLFENLLLVGVDSVDARVIHEQLQGEDKHRLRAKAGCTATLTALRRSGYLTIPYNIKKLEQAGFING